MWVDTQSSYEAVLYDFKNRFNTNTRARKLVQGWNRLILLESTDTGDSYCLVVDGQELTDVRRLSDADQEAGATVHLQAEEQILKEIFSGKYNPATALTDGVLAVFSPDRDKVKLEALAMVIWRLG
jgi:putative sterol carrier protein